MTRTYLSHINKKEGVFDVMRISELALILGLITFGVAHAETTSVTKTSDLMPTPIKSDYRAVSGLRAHLPLNVAEAATLSAAERDDAECIAWNLYFEIRGGTPIEQAAVAYVPINRLGKRDFGNSICANVFQYGWAGGRRQYQFSWAGIVLGKNWKREDDAWEKMQRLAIKVYRKEIPDPARATYFHAWYLSPLGSYNHNKVRLGAHVFWNESNNVVSQASNTQPLA